MSRTFLRFPFLSLQLPIALLVLLLSSAALASINYARQTPGYEATIEGSRAYHAGHHKAAMSKFMVGARWADKIAQFNIGIMHYHGHGVERDPARAWAWLSMAAERGYPEMVEVAESVGAQLSEAQRERGQRILTEELLPAYGDAVAIERTANRMQRERRRTTGSRTGFINGMTVTDRNGQTYSGDQFYSEELWDFGQIVELETRIFRAIADGAVTLGELELAEDED